ncbi:hypothetical protein JTE90_024982 [Oedothorax gibbosus]|uniref:Major facilitator superfamily (MFS) profile domain-containing protein n=1 Tax=Oedothorax gibbosus TaxID=931172 RepID=A0AAV6VXE0_9ARAC|nr:hypothetical protein JTE90_024982 [Oedothorax gibbosus]
MSQTNPAFVNQEEFVYDHNVTKWDDSNALPNVNNILPNALVGLPPTKRKRSKQRYVTVAVLTLINLINYVDRYTIAGILDDVQKYYGLGNTEGGLLQTSFIVSYMIMAPIFGYLGDRYSRKVIIAIGVAFWSLTTLLGSFIPPHLFGLFIFLRALVGTGEASYSTIAPTIIGDLFSKDLRSKMLAVFYFAIPVGSGLGYVVGAQMISLFGAWQWALRITPAIGFLSVILTFVFVQDPPRGEAEGSASLEATTIKDDLLDLAKTKSFVFSTLGFTCVTFATGALGWFGPKYMDLAIQKQSLPGLEPASSSAWIFGVITCIAGLVGVIMGSSGSQYLRKINGKADPLICAFGVLVSVPLVFSGIVVADYTIIPAWILIFLGQVCLCVNWTIVADMLLYVVIPTRRSMAEALQILFSHALGDATSPYIIGIVSDAIYQNSSTKIEEFLCLQYALYIPTGVLILGAFFFFVTAISIEKDKAKCSFLTHGIEAPIHITNEQIETNADEQSDTRYLL